MVWQAWRANHDAPNPSAMPPPGLRRVFSDSRSRPSAGESQPRVRLLRDDCKWLKRHGLQASKASHDEGNVTISAGSYGAKRASAKVVDLRRQHQQQCRPARFTAKVPAAQVESMVVVAVE